ncbi:hypothetical protein B0H16DRAFT_1458849 [Mycena metata]|uniref:Nephrocystin-3 n=1 Tax=Mycena metata TaxID=1033252 RepID=A0AAD7J2R0_9AGAR|nr:hypothetical protein B0H16DRAFT_1458849 [Mycena metata]
MVQPMRRGACIQHPWNVSICAEAERKLSPHWIPTLAPIDRDPATAYSFTTLSAPFPIRRSPKQTVCFVGVVGLRLCALFAVLMSFIRNRLWLDGGRLGRRPCLINEYWSETNWVGNPAFLAPVSLSLACCTYAGMPTEVIDSEPVFPSDLEDELETARRQRARVPAATYFPCAHLTEYGAPTFTLSMDIDGLFTRNRVACEVARGLGLVGGAVVGSHWGSFLKKNRNGYAKHLGREGACLRREVLRKAEWRDGEGWRLTRRSSSQGLERETLRRGGCERRVPFKKARPVSSSSNTTTGPRPKTRTKGSGSRQRGRPCPLPFKKARPTSSSSTDEDEREREPTARETDAFLTRSTASAARPTPPTTPHPTWPSYDAARMIDFALDTFPLGAIRKWALEAGEGVTVAIGDSPKRGIDILIPNAQLQAGVRFLAEFLLIHFYEMRAARLTAAAVPAPTPHRTSPRLSQPSAARLYAPRPAPPRTRPFPETPTSASPRLQGRQHGQALLYFLEELPRCHGHHIPLPQRGQSPFLPFFLHFTSHRDPRPRGRDAESGLRVSTSKNFAGSENGVRGTIVSTQAGRPGPSTILPLRETETFLPSAGCSRMPPGPRRMDGGEAGEASEADGEPSGRVHLIMRVVLVADFEIEPAAAWICGIRDRFVMFPLRWSARPARARPSTFARGEGNRAWARRRRRVRRGEWERERVRDAEVNFVGPLASAVGAAGVGSTIAAPAPPRARLARGRARTPPADVRGVQAVDPSARGTRAPRPVPGRAVPDASSCDGSCTLVTVDEIFPTHHMAHAAAAQHSVPILYASSSHSHTNGSGSSSAARAADAGGECRWDRERDVVISADFYRRLSSRCAPITTVPFACTSGSGNKWQWEPSGREQLKPPTPAASIDGDREGDVVISACFHRRLASRCARITTVPFACIKKHPSRLICKRCLEEFVLVDSMAGYNPGDKDQHLALSTLRVTFLSSTSTCTTSGTSPVGTASCGHGGSGGPAHLHGGSGGPAHLHGGTGGVGQGPIVHITASQLITHNLQATVATDQALRLGNIRAAQIASHCPPPSRIFCGREDILNKMHQFFSDTGTQHIYVLHGLGGAGKTQIALKFISESSSCFADIFFIDTSTIATIETGLKNIAVLKDFGNSLEDGLLWLNSKVEEWLLFFDNADDPGINLNDYIPQCNHGNIIITSRNPGMCVYAGSDSLVSDMEEEDAVTLLLKSALQKATSRTEKIAAEIVKSLHYLPLAIIQAGAFISKSRNLDGYLALYMENQARLLSEKPAQSHDHYAWMVYTTWQMSFDRLTSPAAMFLQHCSFLHYNGISEEIFRYASTYQFLSGSPSKEEVQEPLEFLSHFLHPTGEWDSLQFWNATNEIQSYSLINFDAREEALFHPPISTWLESSNSPKPKETCVHYGVHTWDGHFRTFGVGYATDESAPEGGKDKYAKELLEEVLQKQKQFLGEDHPDTLLTMGNLASSYSPLGEHQKAQKLKSVVLEKQKQLLGEDHPDTLFTMGNLANSYLDLGEHQKAQELMSVVLEKRKQLLGDNHPDTLLTMGNLANSYLDLGEHQKAQELMSLVLEKRKQLLGDDHPATLLTMGNLASSYSALGEHQKAQELKSVVLEKQKQLLGEDHPATLLTMGNLASSYSALGEHQKAQELNSVVLEKQKQILGEDHPNTLLIMGNLANSYSALGEHQKAQELKSVVLEKQKQLLGEDHPNTLLTMGNLANSYSALGEHQRAKELQSVVLEKQKQLLGDNHPDTLLTMGNLANSYSDLGEHQRAQELMSVVLEKRKQVLGENHPHTLLTMGNLASSYSDLGEHQKAKELKSVVLEKQKQVLGKDHPDTLRTMGNLANSYSALGEHQKATELKSVVLEKQKQVLGENHPETLQTISMLAISYSALGEHQRAQELMSVVLEKQTQLLSEDHPDTLQTMGNLANSYLALGEYQRAQELQRVVLERKQVLGEDHLDVSQPGQLTLSMMPPKPVILLILDRLLPMTVVPMFDDVD